MGTREPESLWAWVSEYPDGSTGLVGAYVPTMGHTPLLSRSEWAVRKFQPLAKAHAETTGQRVWLRRYTLAEDHEEA
jgi:hypothetical protein